MRILILLLSVLTFGQEGPPVLNASRLMTGTFQYRTLVNGKDAGQSRISIRKSGGNYVYSNVVTGEFSQSWESVAGADFTPASAKLLFGEGIAVKPAFELVYGSNRVTGLAKERKVDQAVAADTVDQRIDWAAVMSLPDYRPAREFRFHVYDPGAGNSLVTVRIGRTETVRVPAGTFQAVRVVYTIDKNKGAEVYQLLVRKQVPRLMVREEFPNGAITELLKVEP